MTIERIILKAAYFIKIIIFVSILCTFLIFNISTADDKGIWIPDLGDGTYKNPIIFADYSDPDVIRVGENFFMAASSFNCFPALPILHSYDLINWKIINHALKKNEDQAFNLPQHGNGVWAPSIRYHDSYFYIYWGDPDRGIFMVKTDNPYGTWDKPVLVKKAYGNIDPCPFWDDDGKVYLVHAFAHSRAGVKSLLQINELSKEGTKILDKGRIVFDGHEDYPTIEGPKIYKRNGYYYIFAPAGGVKEGWQTVLRSRNIYGPYEAKIVLEQGSTSINGPHQGGWVEFENGENWFVHFQDRDAYGRVVHLNPMKWEIDWPKMGEDFDGNGIGEPVTHFKKPDVGKTYPIETPQTSDEFNTSVLGLQWQWQANFKNNWYSLSANPGYLRIFAIGDKSGSENLFLTPNLILQKFPAENFTIITKIDIHLDQNGEQCGLIIMGLDYACLRIRSIDNQFVLQYAICIGAEKNNPEQIETQIPLHGNQIYLQVDISLNACCRFSYSVSGKDFTDIGSEFFAKAGKWIGAKVGLFCISSLKTDKFGYTDIDWFRIHN